MFLDQKKNATLASIHTQNNGQNRPFEHFEV